MLGSFAECYRPLLKEVFLKLAQEQLVQGADGLTCADGYAEQGKPDFTLAYLLLTESTEDVKRAIFARAYERRAEMAEQKADEFSQRFHRSFSLIKTEAQKDRTFAHNIRQGL